MRVAPSAMTPGLCFARLADHPACQPVVCAWLQAQWPGWYGPDGPGDVQADVRRYGQADGLPAGVLAFAQGVPCGFGALKDDRVPGFEPAGPWLGAGFVLPAWRGQGVGLALIRALEAEAARQGCPALFCATATAGTLLRRAGWAEAGTSRLGHQDVVVFRQDLSGRARLGAGRGLGEGG